MVTADGSRLSLVTDLPYVMLDKGGWSPDSRRLVFSADVSSTHPGNREIYIIESDGNGLLRLTNDPGNDEFAVWSRDGTRIIWSAKRNGRLISMSMRPDGTDAQPYSGPDSLVSGLWSPDGRWILYMQGLELFIKNADGSGARKVSSGGGNKVSPAWSPDGTKIVYVGDPDGNQDIWIMNADGSDPTRITDDSGFDVNPSW